MEPIKVILVDNSKTFKDALKSFLIEQYKIQIIGEACSAEEFWKINDYYEADIILMDIIMPKIDGFALAKHILWERRDLKIIAVTMYVDKVCMVTLLEVGFVGCIFKNNIFDELKPALDATMRGEIFFSKNILLRNNGSV